MRKDHDFAVVHGLRRIGCLCAWSMLLCLHTGCWAPLYSPGIPARHLPDSFRMPSRTGGAPLNFSSLTIAPPKDYILGANDQLDIMVVGLYRDAEIRPLRVQVMANGSVHLPLVGAVNISGKNLMEAQSSITEAYSKGYLANPQVNVALVEKGSTSVLVLGEVNVPGVHVLPRYQNDVGHALAAAGGLAEEAADEIEVHRRSGAPVPRQLPPPLAPPTTETALATLNMASAAAGTATNASVRVYEDGGRTTPSFGERQSQFPSIMPHQLANSNEVPRSENILRIPLRTNSHLQLTEEDITLSDGDVVVVPGRRHEVFFVVGQLSATNTVRFTVGDRDRELGSGFVLPRDREIDVVTAVAMAGYIDPIDSPTTVTLQRVSPAGSRTLILVDLIEARFDPQATVLVQPGDIIYLNPDGPWYMRRTIDRVFPDVLLSPYNFLMRRLFIGRRGDF
jgi:polysaccharide biosynthesis/export protein